MAGRKEKQLKHTSEGLCYLVIITWFMDAAWIILGLIKRCVEFKDPSTLQIENLRAIKPVLEII
jgi:hypothetical protein